MGSTLITHATLVFPGERSTPGSLLLSEGSIAALNPPESTVPPDTRRIDAGGRRVTPGLIDLHTHGVGSWLYEQSPESLLAGLAFLGRFGTTSVLPTLYRVMTRPSLPHLDALSRALGSARGVSVPGWHLRVLSSAFQGPARTPSRGIWVCSMSSSPPLTVAPARCPSAQTRRRSFR
jgi:N-acetylglucosamine-6-phosphate deacetylase